MNTDSIIVAHTEYGIIQSGARVFDDNQPGRQAAEAYFTELYSKHVPPEDQSKDDLIECLGNGSCLTIRMHPGKTRAPNQGVEETFNPISGVINICQVRRVT